MKPTSDQFSKDESGQWWYTYGARQCRTRVYVAVCEWCKEEYLPPYRGKTQRAIFCGHACAAKASHAVDPGRAAMEKSSRWKGGTTMRRGYVLEIAHGHPSIEGTKRRYVLQHRLVMEKMIGRYLEADEHVHHKNGIKSDNRPENLELWAKAHPHGARLTERAHCASCTCFKR